MPYLTLYLNNTILLRRTYYEKILNLNICILVTFLFEFLDGSNMIPSQYRLGIAAIILIIDAICAIIAIMESRKKIIQLKCF